MTILLPIAKNIALSTPDNLSIFQQNRFPLMTAWEKKKKRKQMSK